MNHHRQPTNRSKARHLRDAACRSFLIALGCCLALQISTVHAIEVSGEVTSTGSERIDLRLTRMGSGIVDSKSVSPPDSAFSFSVEIAGDYVITPQNSFLPMYFSPGNRTFTVPATGAVDIGNQSFHAFQIQVSVTTGLASAYGSGQATLNGTVNRDSQADIKIWFQYAPTGTLDSGTPDRTPGKIIPAGSTTTAVSDLVSGLPDVGTYDFRLVAAYLDAEGNELPDTERIGLIQSFLMPYPAAGSAVHFDGSGDLVRTPNADNSTKVTDALTLEAWINPMGQGSGTGGSGTILGREGEYLLRRLGDGTIGFVLANTAPGWTHVNTGYVPQMNTWNHIALTYDKSMPSNPRIHFYVNGEEYGPGLNGAGPIGDIFPTKNEFRIGGRQQVVEYFNGEIDDVRVWGRARTQAEITRDFKRGLAGSEPGLLGYFDFNEGTGTTAANKVQGSPNGGLGGDATFVASGAPMTTPTVLTVSASPVGATKATLQGEINPSGNSVNVRFEYGETIAYGSLATVVETYGGISPIRAIAEIQNLQPGTTYHYRCIVEHEDGGEFFLEEGEDLTFTTLVLGVGWPTTTKVTDGFSENPRHCLDGSGNTYVAGSFSGSLSLGQTLVSDGGTADAFIGKMSRGADWLWGNRVITESASEVTIESIGVDANRNVLVAGHFTGMITFPATAPIQLTSDGASDGFVAKLGSSGSEWQWAIRLGTAGSDQVNALVVTSQTTLPGGGILPGGEVMIAGEVGGVTTFTDVGGTGRSFGHSGKSELFTARFNSDGDWLWASDAASDAPGSSSARDLALNAQGDAFVTGEFTGTADFSLPAPAMPLVSAGDADLFVARITGAGQWLGAIRAGGAGSDAAADLVASAGGQVYLFGAFGPDATFASGNTLYNGQAAEGRLFVAELGPSLGLRSYYQAGRGNAGGIALGLGGEVYVTGDFSGTTGFGSPQTDSLTSSGNLDVFVARLSEIPGEWDWVRKIGSSGEEGRGELRVDAEDGGLVVSGTFQNTVQVGYSLLSTSNDHEIFVARLDSEAVFEHNNYVIGQAIPVPVEAQDGDGNPIGQPSINVIEAEHPDSSTINSFAWDPVGHRLYPVRPVVAILKWPLTTDPANTTAVATAVGRSIWPDNPQIHIANAPVEMQPGVAGFPYRFNEITFATNDAAVDGSASKVFTASAQGLSVLQFYDTGGDESTSALKPLHFEVVRTVPWDDEIYKQGVETDSTSFVIGTELTNATHNDPTGKNGWVVFSGAPYDGTGSDKAYDRATRSGPIIPVNLDTSATNDDLVVVWYHAPDVDLPAGGTTKGIAWPSLVVRYQPPWPENPDELVLSSGEGSEVLPQDEFPGKRVYNQPDPSLPGYNPNEEHAALYGDTLYALRNDLNDLVDASEPYVLLKYRAPASAAKPNRWMMKVYKVVTQDAAHPFSFPVYAGQRLPLPSPLALLPLAKNDNTWTEGPGFRDHRGELYAGAAGPGGANAVIKCQFWYPLQPGFYYDFDGIDGPDLPNGTSIPWLGKPNGSGDDGKGTEPPVEITYTVSWPAVVPILNIGDTLIDGDPELDPPDPAALPDLVHFAQAQVIYDDGNPDDTAPENSLVRLYDPIGARTLQIRTTGYDNVITGTGYGVHVPMDAGTLFTGLSTENDAGLLAFTDLPYFLRSRLRFDPLNQNLIFQGWRERNGEASHPLLLPNIMSRLERDRIKKLKEGDLDFGALIDALYELCRDPDHVNPQGGDPPIQIGFERDASQVIVTKPLLGESITKALSAGGATASGYVTVVQNNDPSLGFLPVTLHVIRVEGGPELGDIKVIKPDNVFDEKLTLRHSGDFGGEPQNFDFEWYYRPGADGSTLPGIGSDPIEDGWTKFEYPPPGSTSLGLNDITLGDGASSNLLILADNYYICRYRRGDGGSPWSDWVGNALNPPTAQLVEGWVARVRDGLNPFEARSADFHKDETVTFASMLQQAGTRYEGSVAVKGGDDINQIGLIEAYETVLRRAKQLSIEANPPENFQPANDALLSAAGYIADLYFLLGNEATADAADPTIGFRTSSTGYGTLAPSVFTFQNQVDSLLEEELCLLRGRDDSAASVRGTPVYNRLFWNFTRDEGEVAYAQAYNTTDQDDDGFIGVNDARIMFPQGHGDAWGHYLTATKTYFDLMRNPYFVWNPRTETIQLGSENVVVDNFDERKFARAAAAKAKVGAEIVDLTYRLNYVDDPSGQYQGYKDTDPDRAWGVAEWAQRAGSAALFDWVAANAVLTAEDTEHTGIEKIDRTTVPELDEIIAGYESVQSQVDKADAGLNPLGIAKNSVPFDIDPSLVSSGKTHFEQIYDRAAEAVKNTVTVFDHANQLTQALRSLQDDVNDFYNNVNDQESDYRNRMIEIFGYPYDGDIGSGKTYPAGYVGPDIYHYMYVSSELLTGDTKLNLYNSMLTAAYSPIGTKVPDLVDRGKEEVEASRFFWLLDIDGGQNQYGQGSGSGSRPTISVNTDGLMEVAYPMSDTSYGLVAPPEWGSRRAPGEIQQSLSDVIQSQARFNQAVSNYDALLLKIEDAESLMRAKYDLLAEQIRIRSDADSAVTTLRKRAAGFKIAAGILKGVNEKIGSLTDITTESLPKVIGTSNDATAPVRGGLKATSAIVTIPLKIAEAGLTAAGESMKTAEEDTRRQEGIEIEKAEFRYEIRQQLQELEQLLREEPGLRLEAFALREAMMQQVGNYQAVMAKGIRLMDERIAYRKAAAADTQQNRYQDMTFRIFRNDAIQKYRAQFDLAAKYVYMAAIAYDYETQLLGGDHGAGREFLTDIVRQRSLGEVVNGQPIAGRHGLADPLARLNQNFGVLKGQLGFNNPQTETGRFSLRNGLFRLRDTSDREWRDELKKHVVPNLWDIPEFRRHCRPFAPESAGPQPGLVIRFPSTITYGMNYFGWPLGGGDSAYDSTLFATKVRSAGVWFSNYDGSGLSVTPRVYLVPAGADMMRSPSGNNLETREWRVVDQKIPMPFPIGYSSMNDTKWIPTNDSLSDTLGEIRRFSSFRAYHDSGVFDPAQTISDSRLIGRSVWNTDWVLIIPGGTFLFDADEGLDTFIDSVSDIKVFFQTYAYSGN